MTFYANLHNHTTHSDGVYTPSELVRIAREEGYFAVAATDHDTVTANPEIRQACEEYGMETLFGAEFYAHSDFHSGSYHLTAYDFDPACPEMAEYLRRMSARETDQTKALFERGLRLGLLSGITWEEVLEYNRGISWLCNEHVFRAMTAKGYFTPTDYPSFFKNVYGEYRGTVPPSYDYLYASGIIDLVHAAGGIVMIAHPHNQLEDIPGLVRLGLDGIEVWHADLTQEEKKEALRLAGVYNLYVSGGEDHSGLCGGQYRRYAHPEESEFYAPPLSLGTSEYFFREIQRKSKSPDRRAVITSLWADME